MVNSTLTDTTYVDPVMGNDTNAGTQLDPYKSLTHALKAITAPKIIQLAPGTYNSVSGERFPIVIPPGVMVVGNEATKGQDILISGSGEYQSHSFGVQNIALLLLNDVQLMGVTVTNSMAKGTGVWIESTAPRLANNTFMNCGREGVFISGTAKPVILDNAFVSNRVAGLVMARHSTGEVLRNIFYKNALGIVISDFAAPLVANNKVIENLTGMAFSRNARPVLRHNLIEKNLQGGLLVNGNAVPNLGITQESAGNIFRDNRQFDIHNVSSVKLLSVGNQLNPSQIKGQVELVTNGKEQLIDSHYIVNPKVDTPSYIDLAGHWAEPFIQALVNMGLTPGFRDGTYQPDRPMTRAQYAALVATALNPTPKHSAPEFTDIPKDFWAYDAIRSAAQGGFVGGFSDRTFHPEQNVLKLQVIVSLVNGLALIPTHSDAVLSYYHDSTTIPKSARIAVATAMQNQLIVNYPDPKLIQAKREATRAEVAVMVYQALVAIRRTPVINSPYIVTFPTLGVE
jgi:parallel beta-helix repeat protein